MNDTLTIDCGPADRLGHRLVIATCGPMEHRDHFQTDDAFRRRRFAEAMLEKFAWAVTREILDEIEHKLVAVADREDSQQKTRGELSIDSVRVADVPKVDVAWLWPGRIALGKVTLLAGDPGLGKSFVTLDIAARVSRGAQWPGQCTPLAPREAILLAEREEHTPASVVLLSAEDDVADTIRPRLEAHAADCERIHVVRSVAARDADSSYRRSFDLSRDLSHLESLFDRLPDCRLLVIDPVSAYLGRNIENTNSEVRGLLGPLAALAAERNLAVLAVTHLRKEEGAAMYRTMGSMAFIAAARAAWIVCKDKDDPRRRLLLPVKKQPGQGHRRPGLHD
jgi:putative DNA primase/helicase